MLRLFLLFSFALAGYGQGAFTVDGVMSAPFASSLTASPRGAKLAWLLDEQGRHNVWFAEAPGFKSRFAARPARSVRLVSPARWLTRPQADRGTITCRVLSRQSGCVSSWWPDPHHDAYRRKYHGAGETGWICVGPALVP